MQFKKSAIVLVFLMTFFSCNKNQLNPYPQQIIPIPESQTNSDGEFVIDNETGLQFEKEFEVAANFLKEFIEQGSEITLKDDNDIVFIKDSTVENEEGYKLDISTTKIQIKAKTDRGAFYAVQTLRQMLPVSLEKNTFYDNQIAIQCLLIKDEPAYTYRGMHLDVARHMFPVEFIKKYIDVLALLKMNTFHWHLTDDQGWRIEIKKYPKLQEVAAFRDETLVGHFSDQPQTYDGKRYGGYYTQEQIQDVVAYAGKRFITVIPEIEMPGHAQAAIAAYPELGCTGDSIKVAETWGVFEGVFCTKEKTFEFLEGVLDEVVELFPSEYIHIGGDEAPKSHWKNCAVCQQRIQEKGLKDAHELQSYFIQRIEKYLNAKGKQIIGWDEILEGGLAPNATVMSWRGTNGAVEAAKEHHQVIMTPTSHCYFDYYQSTNSGEPLAIGGYLPLEKVYGFNPIPEALTPEESQYILGVQGNLWTEYISNAKQVEYMVFPRILAMSELGWSQQEHKNYENFVFRVENFNKRLDALDINYANHLYEVEGDLIFENNATSYELKTLIKDKTIRFTLDGSQPSTSSKIYETPILFSQDMEINAAVFNNEERLGVTFTETFYHHKAVGSTISLSPEPSKVYSGSGAQGLINGISGSDSRYGDKEWLGFWGDDIEITIDLGKEIEINSIETRFYNGQGQWIYAPKELEIEFDNETEKQIVKITDSKDNLVYVTLKMETRTRFIKLKIPNYGIIPEGNQGAGNKAWTFIDEIFVK